MIMRPIYAAAFFLIAVAALAVTTPASPSEEPIQNLVELNQQIAEKAPKKIRIIIDGKEYAAKNVEAILVNNTMFVPLRFVSEHLGYSVSWDQTAKKAEINDGTIVAILGEYSITKYNTISYPCAYPSFLSEGSFMVGLRQIANALGFRVSWDQPTMTARLTRPSA